MKLKTLFFVLPVILCSISLSAQVLKNTTWDVYDTTGVFFRHYHFGTDTIFFSADNVNYSAFAHYSESQNELRWVDFGGSICFSDTGKYNVLVQNDTLILTEIQEVCGARLETATKYTWVLNTTTGIFSKPLKQPLKIYPNPVSDVMILEYDSWQGVSFVIIDLTGREVKTGVLKGNITPVFVEELHSGVYVIQFENSAIPPQKIIKR